MSTIHSREAWDVFRRNMARRHIDLPSGTVSGYAFYKAVLEDRDVANAGLSGAKWAGKKALEWAGQKTERALARKVGGFMIETSVGIEAWEIVLAYVTFCMVESTCLAVDNVREVPSGSSLISLFRILQIAASPSTQIPVELVVAGWHAARTHRFSQMPMTIRLRVAA